MGRIGKVPARLEGRIVPAKVGVRTIIVPVKMRRMNRRRKSLHQSSCIGVVRLYFIILNLNKVKNMFL